MKHIKIFLLTSATLFSGMFIHGRARVAFVVVEKYRIPDPDGMTKNV